MVQRFPGSEPRLGVWGGRRDKERRGKGLPTWSDLLCLFAPCYEHWCSLKNVAVIGLMISRPRE